MVGVIPTAGLLIRVFARAGVVSEPALLILLLEVGSRRLGLLPFGSSLLRDLGRPCLRLVCGRYRVGVLLLMCHDPHLHLDGLLFLLALLVRRLSLGVVRVGPLIGLLVLVRPLPGPLRRRASFLFRFARRLAALLLPAAISLIGHG